MTDLAARIRSEAAISSRYGQLERLEAIADEVEFLESNPKPTEEE